MGGIIVNVTCIKCKYIQNLRPTSVDGKKKFYNCKGCSLWMMLPEEFRGEFDNRPKSRIARQTDKYEYVKAKRLIKTVKSRW